MKKLVLLFLLSTGGLKAQFIDSLRDVIHKKSSVDVRLESRYGFIDHRYSNVRGLRLGIAFERKLRMGGGLSWLNSDLPVRNRPQSAEQPADTTYFKFIYLTYYLDVVFYKNKRWQLSVPLQAGLGMSWYQMGRVGTDEEAKYLLLLYEPGINIQFKIFKWWGIGSDIAYRFGLKNNNKVPEQMNSPTYCLKSIIWFNQLYYVLFPNSRITKKHGPAFW